MDRRMIGEFESLLDRIEAELTPERLDIAVALAELPQSVRGFGPVKLAAAQRADEKRRELLADWDWRPVQVDGASTDARSSAA
jgi:indolepyruvate ferredoxin oxidoreductase